MSNIQRKEKYGIRFPATTPLLEIEFFMIRQGEKWLKDHGSDLYTHYRNAQALCWPDEDHHRWSDLILSEILKNDITSLMACKDSGKTHGMAKYALIDYWAFPDTTLIIVSSDTLQSLERRVWGDIKGLYSTAKKRYPWLPGHILDSKHCICTDDLSDESVIARDLRKGIAGIPCKNSSGGQTNIAAYVGIKQKRKRYMADEFQFMSHSMYESLSNAIGGDFKMVCAGNPIGQGDPLDLVSEPKCGWEGMPEPEKTTTWDNLRFMNSRTVNLVGTDSPNFDYPEDEPIRFSYMINRNSIAKTVAGYGLDSHQYYSQCKGVRRSGLNARRVITRAICLENHAFDDVEWHGTEIKKIFALDAAYGGVGGDRCVGGHIEFGMCADGKVRIRIVPPRIVHISLRKTETAEDQIAAWIMDYCSENEIPPENCYYDSTGRGSLGIAISRLWSSKVHPVEFGGVPSKRPVSKDMFTLDPKTRQSRPKRCDELYRKFVTELWWTTRLLIESDQLRGMTESLCKEGCMREWKQVAGNRIEVESKEDTKERMGRSPDEYDWFVTAVEGARRQGFEISKMAKDMLTKKTDWLDKQQQEYKDFMAKRDLAMNA